MRLLMVADAVTACRAMPCQDMERGAPSATAMNCLHERAAPFQMSSDKTCELAVERQLGMAQGWVRVDGDHLEARATGLRRESRPAHELRLGMCAEMTSTPHAVSQ